MFFDDEESNYLRDHLKFCFIERLSANRGIYGVVSLKEKCILEFFHLFYSYEDNSLSTGGVGYLCLQKLILSLSLTHCYDMYCRLTDYVFVNFFYLADKWFGGNINRVYSILFTFIVLSDERYVKILENTSLNGGLMSVIYYFVSDGGSGNYFQTGIFARKYVKKNSMSDRKKLVFLSLFTLLQH